MEPASSKHPIGLAATIEQNPHALHDLLPMQRALRLAALGRGTVEPNPMVGCVIAKDGVIIGEGYHQAFGGPHAEPNALAACRQSPAGATVYVTLEPCCHLNKKTPPCVPRLIDAGVRRVVVGCLDPNPLVAGKGIAQLRSAGVTVDEGILCLEATQLNAAFFKRMKLRRPYVTLKWAQTANGKVAGPGGKRTLISNPTSLHAIHKLRAASDAILVGINTLLADDPLLTARGIYNGRRPRRVVLDRDLRFPLGSKLANSAAGDPVIIYSSQTAITQHQPAVDALIARGVFVKPLPLDKSGALSLTDLLDDLGANGITNLAVEPGPTLAASFITQNLADRVWIIRSPRRIEDATAPDAAKIYYPAAGDVGLDGDSLTEYLNPKSPVFSVLARSADLINLF